MECSLRGEDSGRGARTTPAPRDAVRGRRRAPERYQLPGPGTHTTAHAAVTADAHRSRQRARLVRPPRPALPAGVRR